MKLFSKPVLSLLVFLISFIIYIFTAAPDVMYTDSGELAAVCVTLGIAHPTGYPLFTILGHLWTLIPFPFSKIYSLNLFAAFCTALSSAVFFNIVNLILTYFSNIPEKRKSIAKTQKSKQSGGKKNTSISKGAKNTPLNPLSKDEFETEHRTTINEKRITIDKNIYLISLISALIYCFADTVWSVAIAIEVYSLQLLLINLIIFFVLQGILSGENKKYLFLTAFILGLGFSNHLTTMLLLPAIFFLYFKRPGEKFDFSAERWKFLAILTIPFIFGLSFYLYMPLRSIGHPEFNWGWVSRSWAKFFYHIQGKQYQVWMFSGSDVWKTNMGKFLTVLPYQLAWIGLVPFLFGFFKAFKLSKELGWFLLLLIAACLFYTLNYSIHDIDTYFVTAFIAIIILTGLGLYYIVKIQPKILPFFIVIPLLSLAVNYAENNHSKDYAVSEYTKTLMNNLEPNAVIISAQWDYWVSAFWYKQRVEGYRNDVVFIEKELLRRTWYPEQLRRWYPKTVEQCKSEMGLFLEDLEQFESSESYNVERIQQRFVNLLNCFIDKNYDTRPIYMTLDVFETEPTIAKGFEKIPEGFAFRLHRTKDYHPVGIQKIKMDKFINSLKGRTGHLEKGIRNTAAINIVNIGRYLLYWKQKDAAAEAFERALSVEPKNELATQGLNAALRK